MKTLVALIVVLVMALMVVPVQGGDDAQTPKTYYEAAIAREIADCRQKSALRFSRSPNLRLKGHREASKAMFMETHRVQLVDGMVALNLEPKTYKVHRFLNDRFSCTCYAPWVAKGDL
ncbi:MAG: hypothetical protein JJV98_11080 [Desulfosarcina sp.]|nr:hypothetical protein [Desulfobacterales bacterium]